MAEHRSEGSVETIKDQVASEGKISSPRTRRRRTVLFEVALVSVIGVFLLLAFFASTTPFFPIDVTITRAIQSIDSPLFAELMKLISWPGFSPESILIPLLVMLVLYAYGLHWEAVTAGLAAILSGVTNELVKGIIQRPRPTGNLVDVFAVLESYSFPSGHVMFYVSFFGFLWFLVYTLLKPSLIRSLILSFVSILILLVGVSRIYLGQHWASDVLGAYLLGSLILLGIIALYRWGRKRFFVRQAVVSQNPTRR